MKNFNPDDYDLEKFMAANGIQNNMKDNDNDDDLNDLINDDPELRDIYGVGGGGKGKNKKEINEDDCK